MPSEASRYITKELSLETWPDLEKLFTKPGIGSASGCWCMFHHTASFTAENTPGTKAEGAVKYRREKKELVKKGESHGIIVYGKNGDPIGWCQYGPREELPRMDHNRIYLDKARSDDEKSFWRITCFVVDKNYRRKGVASAALNAVLESIKKKGEVSSKPTR